MSFEEYEISEHDNSKVLLYKFETDDGLFTWRYTSDKRPRTILGDVYVPEVIRSGDLQQGSGEDSAQRLDIVVPYDNPVAVLHVPYLPPRPVLVTVYAIQRRDESATLVQSFIGEITNFAQKGPEVTLQCAQIIESVNKSVPSATFQSGCVHATYEFGCFLNRELFKTVVAGGLTIDGNTISAAAIDVLADDWFKAGVAQNPATGEVRFILAHVGPLITLDAPFITLDADSDLWLFAGDDHLPETCRIKFNNKLNYLGFDFMPTFNVFEKGVD